MSAHCKYTIWPLQGAHLCWPARSVHACLFYFFTQVKAHTVHLHYSSSAPAFSQRPSLSTHARTDTHTQTLHEALHYIRISADLSLPRSLQRSSVSTSAAMGQVHSCACICWDVMDALRGCPPSMASFLIFFSSALVRPRA